MVPPLDRTWMIGSWPVHEYQIPIIIGISSGVLILLLIIAVLIAWRCCHIHRLHEKTFGGRTPVIHSPSTSSYPSVLAMSVSASKQASPLLTSRHRLASNSCELVRLTSETPNNTRRADVLLTMAADRDPLEKQFERHSHEDMSLVGCGNYVAFDIPSFYEESLNTSSMSASSNAVLDVSWSNGDDSLNELKTRSLPAWARHKGSIRTAQQIQVRTVKMKETGRNNAAAALIALSKSSQNGNNIVDVMSDRVSLVAHKDAVIVFNERTAL